LIRALGADVEIVMLNLELGKSSLSIGKSAAHRCSNNEKRAERYLAEVANLKRVSMRVYLMYVISVSMSVS
jgi:hypothetical protein